MEAFNVMLMDGRVGRIVVADVSDVRDDPAGNPGVSVIVANRTNIRVLHPRTWVLAELDKARKRPS